MIPIRLTPKQIGVTIGVLFLVVLLIWIISKVKNGIENTIEEIKLIDEVNAETDPKQITMTQSQINTLASKIYAAVKGSGTDEEAIFAAFKELSTRSDLMKLIDTFGRKDGMSLKDWLYDDLDEEEIVSINEILASKEINYVF